MGGALGRSCWEELFFVSGGFLFGHRLFLWPKTDCSKGVLKGNELNERDGTQMFPSVLYDQLVDFVSMIAEDPVYHSMGLRCQKQTGFYMI